MSFAFYIYTTIIMGVALVTSAVAVTHNFFRKLTTA